MLLNLASEWKSKHFKDKRILQKQKRSASEDRPIYILPGVLWIFNERPSTQIEKETTKHKFRRDFLFFSLLFFSKKEGESLSVPFIVSFEVCQRNEVKFDKLLRRVFIFFLLFVASQVNKFVYVLVCRDSNLLIIIFNWDYVLFTLLISFCLFVVCRVFSCLFW